MSVPYAWRDLVHDRGRTTIAALGVAFAVLLMLMQLGFYGAVGRTAVLVEKNMLFDVLICSRHYRFIASPGTIPVERLQQARGVAGVETVLPLDVAFVPWRTAAERKRARAILVIGIDPEQPGLDLGRIGARGDAVRQPDSVLIDRKSRPEFGPQAAGTRATAGAKEVTIAGSFEMGTGFGADGAILASQRTLRRLQPAFSPDADSFGLIRVEQGADVDDVARRLRDRLPTQDMRIMTRAELVRAERRHWIEKTSVGLIFGMGVVTSLVVGMAIVSQVLGNKVMHHLREFATMKALGYPQRYITRTVLAQAAAIAMVGYLPGLLVAGVAYAATAKLAHIPMVLGAWESGAVLLLALGMCAIAATTALRKVARAAPADLF